MTNLNKEILSLDYKALKHFPDKLEAVIFDMDGLLLDTESYSKTAIFNACESLGAEMTDNLHLSLIGTPKELGEKKLRAAFGDKFDVERYSDLYHTNFAALIAQEVPKKPGASELLKWLKKQNIQIAIATSTPRVLAISNLMKADLYQYIGVLVSRTDVTHGKPHPETYLTAVSSMGVNLKKCIAFEDSYNGIRSATSADIPTIMIPDLLPATEEMHQKTLMVLESLIQALEIFARKYHNV